MKAILLFISSLMLVTKTDNELKVEYKGALMEIMHGGDISSRLELKSIKQIEHLYGVGELENLKGEITIIDGKSYVSEIKQGQPGLAETYDKNAALIVYSKVDKWQTIDIPEDIKTREQLEVYLPSVAEKSGINIAKPFPFKIIGKANTITWQVISWDDDDTKFSFAKYMASGQVGTFTNENVELLGFFSKKHQHVWTFHDTYLHLHGWFPGKKISAHVYGLELLPESKLLLPAN
ncbi:MAG: hypothetical protein JWN76_2485 [Chitinophagaceae bacterium]|nr:hypothetical protein [Chitinophagaceae bacterium]